MTEETKLSDDPVAGGPVAVVGARGKTGRAIVSALADRGVSATPIGRDEIKNPVQALQGCRAVYLMAPNLHPDELGFISTLLEACREARVDRVVYHSVAAPHAPGMLHHVVKAAAEDVVRRSGLQWSILQPCAYIENMLPGLRGETPHLDVAYSVDTRFGLISVLDVGEVAAAVLLDDSHIGATYELGGPQQITIREYAAVAERVLNRAVELNLSTPGQWSAAQRNTVQAADETADTAPGAVSGAVSEAQPAAPGSSLEPREIEWLEAMFSYYDAYGLPCGTLPARSILGHPARSVEEVLRAALS